MMISMPVPAYRIIKRGLLLLCIVLALIVAMLSWNFLRVQSAPSQSEETEQLPNSSKAVERLRAAIRLPTVTGEFAPEVFLTFLREYFPDVFTQLRSSVVNQGGLVLHWPVASSKLKPVLFLAHYDVVPATDADWTHPPFSGKQAEGYIWGRGTMDDKLSVLAMLQAIESLLHEGFVPQRDIYLAFGHDEETGGQQGAAQIADYFLQQGLEFEYALDEGLLITDGILPFVNKPVALIGIAEKGYADIELSIQGAGGHASMPGQLTLLGELSTAVSQLQSQPMPAQLSMPTRAMLTSLAPESTPLFRLMFTNLWLFEPLLHREFAKRPATHAAINTTFAPTMMTGSNKINVLPHKVSAYINVRMLPGVTSAQVIAHMREVIDNENITVRVVQVSEPVKMSAVDSWGYRQISRAIHQVYPDTLVAPGLVIPATDSRHYAAVALQIYRFLPITVQEQDLVRIHGRDERIAEQAYHDAIRFYYQCMKNSARAVDM